MAAKYDPDLGRWNNWTYGPLEFRARFRLPKEPVYEVCNDFWDSGFSTTKAVSYTHLTLPTICSV